MVRATCLRWCISAVRRTRRARRDGSRRRSPPPIAPRRRPEHTRRTRRRCTRPRSTTGALLTGALLTLDTPFVRAVYGSVRRPGCARIVRRVGRGSDSQGCRQPDALCGLSAYRRTVRRGVQFRRTSSWELRAPSGAGAAPGHEHYPAHTARHRPECERGHDGLRDRCGSSPYWLRFRECRRSRRPQRPATSAPDRKRLVGIRRLHRATDWAVSGRDRAGVPGVELFRPFFRLARQRDDGVGLGQPGARGRPLDDHGRQPRRYGPRHVRQRENRGDPLPSDRRSGMSGFQRQHPVPEVCDMPMTTPVAVYTVRVVVSVRGLRGSSAGSGERLMGPPYVNVGLYPRRARAERREGS